MKWEWDFAYWLHLLLAVLVVYFYIGTTLNQDNLQKHLKGLKFSTYWQNRHLMSQIRISSMLLTWSAECKRSISCSGLGSFESVIDLCLGLLVLSLQPAEKWKIFGVANQEERDGRGSQFMGLFLFGTPCCKTAWNLTTWIGWLLCGPYVSFFLKKKLYTLLFKSDRANIPALIRSHDVYNT